MTEFQSGDRLVHARRPEWGVGTVKSVKIVKTGEQPSQRLVIEFANHGRVTLNTAHAELRPANGQASPAPRQSGWLDKLESRSADDSLTAIPEAATDPFRSLAHRLEATLELYRFTDEGRSLIDWAVAQTQSSDPLSHQSRHELERAFSVFAQARDAHLRVLLLTIKRKGESQLIESARNHPIPGARDAVQRALRFL